MINCAITNSEAIFDDIEKISKGMDSIQLKELQENNQMNRFDKKFIFHSSLIPTLLEKAKDYYSILVSNGSRMSNYHSCYFDTPDFKMYTSHHNGKTNRYKIRIREYLDSGDRFVEVKHKNSQSFTTKERIPYTHKFPFTTEATDFIKNKSYFDPENLILSLITKYKRITLINKRKDERITIDFRLFVEHGNKEVEIKNLAIAEVKNGDRHDRTHFIRLLKSHHITQESFSKYCIGTALLNKNVKHNIFKEKIRRIKKIENEPSHIVSQSNY